MTTRYLFNRRNRTNKNNESLIELEIYVSRGSRRFRSTGIFVKKEFWDKTNQRIKSSHPNADLLNTQLQIFKQDYDSFLLRQKINNQKLDISIFERQGSHPTFFEFFDRSIEVTFTDLSIGTIRVYKRTLKYLKEFSKDLPLNSVNVNYCNDFNLFLADKKNLSINSRATLFKKFKRVMGEAVKNDYISYSENPFNRGYKIKVEPVETKSLTLKELKAIEDLDMEQRPELNQTRDMFLFACYTSMRFGDLTELSFENFEILANGDIRLSYLPNKTKKTSKKRIEWITTHFWNGKLDKIILKYLDKYEYLKNTPKEKRPFFNYTNQFYNRQLKELQRFAKIKQVLTSHLARSTCITLLVNDFELPIDRAQIIAGHSKIEQTRQYLKTTERDLSNSAKKIDWDK